MSNEKFYAPKNNGDIWYGTRGPTNADIMIVGEAWGFNESQKRQPFIGPSGAELQRMLQEAGINMNQCFITNVLPERPPSNDMSVFFATTKIAKGTNFLQTRGLYPQPNIDEGLRCLYAQINAIKPKLIIACGNYALWALSNHCNTGNSKGTKIPTGIMSWRGSQTYTDIVEIPKTKLLPIIHPAMILRQWNYRQITVNDLCMRVPLAIEDKWDNPNLRNYHTDLSFFNYMLKLDNLIKKADKGYLEIATDIETMRECITCLGLATDRDNAIVIPFFKILSDKTLDNYFTKDEFVKIGIKIRELFNHPNVYCIGQNFSYDCQYLMRIFGVRPKVSFDTMVAHHLCFPTLPKGLDMLSSMYNDFHTYWKDDGKEWNAKGTMESLLMYNGDDCTVTFEVKEHLEALIKSMNLEEQFKEQMEIFEVALDMMHTGVLIDRNYRFEAKLKLTEAINQTQARLIRRMPKRIIPETKKGAAMWYGSTKQLGEIFYDKLGVTEIKNKQGGRTTDDEALRTIGLKYPLLRPICDDIKNLRSMGVFVNNFLSASVDGDGRMRSSFNIAGPYTFRWSSSTNAFGGGTNLQNIPEGDD